MANRKQPLIQIWLYGNGAEPYFGSGSDRGAAWYSILSKEYQFGTASAVSGRVVPALEYIDEGKIPAGLVCRPFCTPQNIGTWTALAGDAGTWETLRPYQNPPVTWLAQTYPGVNTSGTTTATAWGRESPYQHPANVVLAFRLKVADVSPEYVEATGGIPYAQVSWSGGLWGVRFYAKGSPILVKKVAGVYVPLIELKQPPTKNSDGSEEVRAIVRIQRGALLVSLDDGDTYDELRDPTGVAITMPAGTYQFTGLGCAAAVSVAQAVLFAGTYDSPRNPQDRARSASPTITYKGALGTNSTLAVTSLAGVSSLYLQYRATLTPGTISAHWTYYTSPELYTVELSHPPITSAIFASHDGGAHFEGRIIQAQITKPEELDQVSLSFTARYTVAEGGPSGQFALRKVKVWGGWLYDDGSHDLRCMFTGWLTDASFTQTPSNFIEGQFRAESIALRPKRMRYSRNNCRPYDGLTLTQAFARWLTDMGLNSTYGLGHAQADLITIPAEYPEEPAYLPQGGESRWPMIADLFRAGRLELGVTDDGLFAAALSDTWNLTGNNWAATPVDTGGRIETLTHSQDVLSTYTALEMCGVSPFGEALSATIRDQDAEENLFSSRFRPWVETEVETIDYPVSRGWLNVAAQGKAYECLVPQFPMTWHGELAHAVQRRDRIFITGTSVGTPNLTPVGVRTLTHTFDINDPAKWTTELSGQKLTL